MTHDFLRTLAARSRLVSSFLRGGMAAGAFLQRYDDFYHVAALDGHEGGAELLAGVHDLAAIHADVQRVVDRVAPAGWGQDPQYRAANRIEPGELAAELRKAVDPDEIDRLAGLISLTGS